jgi:hypothetical protein
MSLTISLIFAPGTTTRLQTAMLAAATTWTSLLTGYQPGITLPGVTVYAEATAIDGASNILAMAGPSQLTRQNGYTLAVSGSVVFDEADVDSLYASGALQEAATHEIAHVLGFGSLWAANGLYIANSGRYTGRAGLAAYRQEFDARAEWVPAENSGHWPEATMGRELMTPILDRPAYLSQTTVQSFQDLAFTVALVGEPGALAMMVAGSLLWLLCVAGWLVAWRREQV